MKILGSTTDGETIFAVAPAAMSELSRAMKIIAEFLGGMGAAGSGAIRDAGCGIRGRKAEGGGGAEGEVRGCVGVGVGGGGAEGGGGTDGSAGGVAPPSGKTEGSRDARPPVGNARAKRVDSDDIPIGTQRRKKICAVCRAEFVDTGRTNQRRVCTRSECLRKWRRERKHEWQKKWRKKAAGGGELTAKDAKGAKGDEGGKRTELTAKDAKGGDFAARRIELIRAATEKANSKMGGI